MFCSSSVSVHLLRGAAAIGLILAAFFLSSYGVIWSVVAGFRQRKTQRLRAAHKAH
jgi:hypothetical protein